MRKVSAKTARRKGNGMRAEYDFTGGLRGKHYRAMQAGYTITIHQPDGTTVTKEVKPKEGAVILAWTIHERVFCVVGAPSPCPSPPLGARGRRNGPSPSVRERVRVRVSDGFMNNPG